MDIILESLGSLEDLKAGVYAGVKAEAKQKLNERKIAAIDWNTLTNDSAGATTLEKQIEVFNATRNRKNRNASYLDA